VNKRVFDEQIQ
jgi:hypothetical protein